MELLLADCKQSLQVNEKIFGARLNEGLIHQVVVAYMARARAGTSAQKTRAEVRGGGAKPWKQKGTGRARAGTIRSPLWRKGGVTFASKTRDYTQKVNKKMYRGAICSILSELYRTGGLLALESFDCKTPKTRELKEQLKNLEVENVLIICDEVSPNLYLAARNLHHVTVIDREGINPLDLVRHQKIIMTANVVKQLEGSLV